MSIKTIEQTLQEAYRESDQATVKLSIVVPLGLLRHHYELFSQLEIEAITPDDLKSLTATQQLKIESPATKTAAPKKVKPAKATPRTSTRAPVKVTVMAVNEAIKAGHTSPVAIAKVLEVAPKVVSKALSRYLKRGLVIREAVGQYRLPPESANDSNN